ncbi:hypothetical protein H8B06_18685 [Sphingobacterium sp. DN00404]|uniref:Phage tail tape measure protein n=1 Tax=Sphingobacterium micropteri TaxID=2763501 RepID=A0ABR7YU21_9SPHI|nr:hypothetical protein [Sphingobacterium micropteri]MBD1434857.1 hypothetical protein [Sphingobacterium micropteri]
MAGIDVDGAPLKMRAEIDTKDFEKEFKASLERIRKENDKFWRDVQQGKVGNGVSKQSGTNSRAAFGATNELKEAQLRLKEAQIASIEAIRRTREERAKEISSLNVLKQAEQEAKNILTEKRAALAQYNLEQRKSSDEQKKAIQEERKAEKALRDTEKARKDAERELAKQNRETERRRKQLEKESSEYYKLNSALGNVRKRAKDVGAEMFKLELQGRKNTAAYEVLRKKSEALTKQTNILDTGIKKIDASLGLHQRHVGDYTRATEMIIPVVGRVNSQLAEFGLTLDDLAKKPGAIKEIGAAFVGLGRSLLAFIATPVGAALAVLGTMFALFQRNKQTVMDFNARLRDVSKTTGIAGQNLRDLGGSVVDLSMKLKVVDSKKLLEHAAIAGQLGEKGRENILAYAEAMAMLETASDISGEQGGKEIARLLTLVDGGIHNVKLFGDEVVNLGNNFAASESEILSNAEAIAQNTGLYRIGRQEVLAYATATKSLGIEAEVVGSTFQKTLGSFEKSIRSGKGVADILKVVGGSAADLERRFREDASGVFQDYIKGLNAIHKAGGSVQAQMERNGITDIRQRRVIGTLAAGYDTLARAMDTVRDASGAMQEEFENGAGKLVNQTRRMGIAWDNFVLSIEDGEGAIGRSVVAIVGFFADLLDQINKTFNPTSLDEFLARLVSFDAADRIREINKSMTEAEKVSKKVSEFDFSKASQRELNDIFIETTSAIESTQKAFDKYKKDVNAGILTEGGKNNFKDFEETLNFLRVRQANMYRLGARANGNTATPTGSETQNEVDEKAKRAAERAAEQARQAVERQRALQGQIDQLNEQSLRGQLSRDEQEVASIRDKYAKIREEVRKFYADPKNKGLRVNMSGISQAENFEISEATTRQETVRLVEQLNKQKAIYDEYNNYVEQKGSDAADRLFGKQAEIAKGYRQSLDDEYISLLGKQKSASTGGAASSKFTQAEEDRLKQLQAMRDAEAKGDEVKTRKRIDEAIQLAQTFNDKRLEIERKYLEARKALGKNITPEQEQELQKGKNKELSQLASEELSQSDAWQKLFSDLDALTVSQIDTLVNEIEAKFDKLSGTFDPIDLAAVRKRLNEARDLIIADNPFKRVSVAINEIFKSSSKESKATAEDIKRQWNNLAKATEGSFEFVANAVNSAAFLKDAIGEVGQTALMSMMSVATTAIAVSAAIKTAEKASVILAIIQAALVVVNAIAGLFKSIFNKRDKELEKSIESKKEAVEALDRAFQQLERSMNRAAGSDYYKTGEEQIKNLKEQRKLMEQMKLDEEDKKKTDKAKVQEYNDSLQSIDNKIEDIGQTLTDTLLQSTFKDLADDLADALISAMEEGEKAIDKLNEAYDDFIKDAITNSAKMSILQPVIKEMMDEAAAYAKKNNYSLEGFDFNAWRGAIEGAGGQFIDNVQTMFEGLGLDMSEATSSLKSEGISRATEDQFSEYLGINRAIYDINKQHLVAIQAQTGIQNSLLAVANDRLVALNAIEVNTANTVARLDTALTYLKHLQSIDSNLGGRYN